MKKTDRNSKPDGFYEPHLVLSEIVLPAGGEWSPQLPGWVVIHVHSGVGYWMHRQANVELATGAVLLLSDQIQGCIRASQVGDLHLQFFRAEPAKLAGLVTLADQTLLEHAAKDDKLSLRLLPPNASFSDRLKKIHSKGAGNIFPSRAQLLVMFLEIFAGDFAPPQVESAVNLDASMRLRRMLSQMPVSELIEISFSDLVSQAGCSPRHVSRLFTELVGVSFREKQVELRLARACELLATTDSKVVDVALASGYQSTSLFNLIFKQRFGISPAKWRDRLKRRKPAREMVRRLRVVA